MGHKKIKTYPIASKTNIYARFSRERDGAPVKGNLAKPQRSHSSYLPLCTLIVGGSFSIAVFLPVTHLSLTEIRLANIPLID